MPTANHKGSEANLNSYSISGSEAFSALHLTSKFFHDPPIRPPHPSKCGAPPCQRPEMPSVKRREQDQRVGKTFEEVV